MITQREDLVAGHRVMRIEEDGSFRGCLLLDGPLVDGGSGISLDLGALEGLIGDGWSSIASPRQVHGDRILAFHHDLPMDPAPEADGVMISCRGAVGAMRYADCVPVLLGVRSEPLIVGLHSGYSGTVLGICERALDAMEGTVTDWSSVWAWVGPSVCGGCYSRRVHDPATARGMRELHSSRWRVEGDLVYFDIKGAVADQLRSRIPASNVMVSPLCTFEDPSLPSFRRDRTARRMVLLFGLPKV